MSIKAYIAESGFAEMDPYQRSRRMREVFGAYLNNPANAQRKQAYENGAGDIQKGIYEEFEGVVREAYPNLFTVTAAEGKPLKIKTRNGNVLEGPAAEQYVDAINPRRQNAPKFAYETLQEKRDPVVRPLMDEETELFAAAIKEGAITPEDLGEDELQSVLPVIRAVAPDKAEAFLNEERKRLKKQGVNANSFVVKSAIRGASPSDTMTEKFDEWFGDDETLAKYRRWQQAYPSQSNISDTGGAIAGLVAGGKGFSTLINGVTNPGKAKLIPSLIGYAAADATYSGKLPGFITEYADVDPESLKGRSLTALEGLAIAGALDLPVQMVKAIKGRRLDQVLKEDISKLSASGKLSPEQAKLAAERLHELTSTKPVTGRRTETQVESVAPSNRLREGYRWLREEVQDPWYRIRKLNEELGVGVDDDFYTAVRLEQGKTQRKVETVNDQMLGTLKKVADTEDALGLGNGKLMKTVNDYLAVRHAPDFNKHVQEAAQKQLKELEKKAANGDKGAKQELKALKEEKGFVLEGRASGLSDMEANEIRAGIESSELFPQIKEYADELHGIHRQTLDVLREGGLITEDTHKALRESMPNHVPFQRVMDELDVDEYFAGTGLDAGRNVNNSGLKKAVGSERQINDIAENIYAGLRGAIERSQRNISNQKMLNFAKKYDPDGSILEVTRGAQAPKDAVSVFVDGEKQYVRFKDPDLQRAFSHVPKRDLNALMKGGLIVNRVLGRLYTGYNPDFPLPNKIRDLADGMANAYREIGFRGAIGVGKSSFADSKAVFDYVRKKPTADAKLYAEMIEEGGSTGGISHMVLGRLDESFKTLEKRAYSNPRQFAAKFNQVVDDINMIFEDSTRLGAYRNAKKAGKTRAEAARIARDISFDPMLRGRSTDTVQSMYLFFNPAIQSARNVAKTMTSPKRAAVIGGSMLGVQYTIDTWNRLITGDPEYRQKLGGYEKNKAFTIITDVNNDPNAEFTYKMVSLPVSYGLAPVKAANDFVIDLIQGREADAVEAGRLMAASVLEAYNPLGGSDFTAAFVPTNVFGVPVDLPVEIARNRTGLGNAIRPPHEEMMNPRDYAKFFDYTANTREGQLAIDAARLLYKSTGFDVSPENIQHVYQNLTGGPGKTLTNLFEATAAIVSGEDLDARNIPIVRRFYRKASREAVEYRTGRDTELGERARDERTRTILLNKKGRQIASQMQEIWEKSENPVVEMRQMISELPEEDKADPELWNYTLRKFEALSRKVSPDSKLIQNNFGVANGARAKLYTDMLQGMSPEERVSFVEREVKAGNLTPEVMKQITEMVGASGNP